ncbi:hypothetical protein HMI54_010862, partial [Coelomomyces lativittatus]
FLTEDGLGVETFFIGSRFAIQTFLPGKSERLTSCHIGNIGYLGDHLNLNRTQPLCGQLGVVVLLEDTINNQDVKEIYKLGPNFTPEMDG